jgi:FAD/FMN-containing dehydrogenase
MSTMPVPARPADDLDQRLAALRHRIDGEVLTPGDPGFREAAQAWNRNACHDPAVIVVAEDVGDVIAAVTFAAERGLGLGVQATGHGVALPVDGVLLVTSRMDGVEVDAEERTAWIQAGTPWGPVLAAAQARGLAPLVGSSLAVGAVGFTLGGGLGWLARRFGPSCDAVRSLEVVTPDGALVCASRDEHPALFHALRGGGGGSLGVVTEMEVQLFPVTTVYGGDLTYRAEDAADVLEQWSRWVADVPDELTSSVVLLNGPGGRGSTIVRGCWSGPVDAGRALLDEWRALRPPVVDGWGEQRFADLAALSAEPTEPTARLVTGGWLAAAAGQCIDRGAGQILAAATFGADGPPALRYCEVRHAGGAVATSAKRGGSSMGNRDGAFLLHLVGVVDDEHDAATIARHLDATTAALGAHLSDRTYLNVLDGPTRAAAAPTSIDAADLAAIAAVAAEVDPDHLLRYGVHHHVRPRPASDNAAAR